MAARYWVGGTGTWDNLALLKWATTSGGVGGQAVPTSSDTVFFDANSGANTVTIGAGTAICSTLTMTGFTGTLAFGSNSINLAGSGTIYTGATTFSVSGTPLMLCTSSNTANRVVVGGAVTEANSISFNVTAGPNAFAANGSFRDLIFSGTFTGSLSNSVKTLYGNLTLKTGMTVSAGNSGTTFAATSGTQFLTSSALTLDFPVTINGVGTTVQLVDALIMGGTRQLTLTSGTFNSNAKNVTCGQFSATLGGTKTLNISNSTFTVLGGTSTTGFLIIGTGSSYNLTGCNIVFTSSGVTSFYLSGGTPTTVTMSGTGQLIIGQAGTTQNITTLQNTAQPCTVSLLSTISRLVVTNFNLSGTSGNLVTFNSSVAGTARNIQKTSGTVNAYYLNIQDSNASGGAVWNAYDSTNAGNNTGWNFLTTNNGNFFMMFN